MWPAGKLLETSMFFICVGMTVTNAPAQQVVVSIPAPSPTEQIDHFIAQDWADREIEPAARCSDRDFVRRLYLDLAGRVPTAQETDSFLEDQREDKRQHLVDALLQSEDHVQHLADVLDALLMGRTDEGKYAEREANHWRNYLEEFVRQNRPWNKVAAEILLARPENQSERGAVWYLYEQNNNHQAIAESIAPFFFGLRIECAQCHDHMIVDEIKQSDYWGLVAFFNRGKNTKTKLGPRVVESAIGGFSEFADLTGSSYPNLLSFLGSPPLNEKRPAGGQDQEDLDTLYVSGKPSEAPRVPKFSRRQAFIEQVVTGNRRIALAMVNRVWALLMGRGIVHPFDEMDSMHPPSHPDLLDELTNHFMSSGYKMRGLIRSIVLSRAYQLSSRQPPGAKDPASFAWALERPLTAEQMARSVQLAVRGKFNNDAPMLRAFRQQFRDVLPDTFVAPVADALYLSNHPALDEFIRASNAPDHLRAQTLQQPTHSKRVELLFNTIFHRPPAASEQKAITDYLEQRESDLGPAIDQVIWSMLTSAEFRLNH